jgi:hypothetical protein
VYDARDNLLVTAYKAVYIMRQLGLNFAARYLNQHGIPVEMAVDVLLRRKL